MAFGEVGGSAEIEAAKMVEDGKFTKPLIVFLAGKFAESLPKDTALGHAGAIVSKGQGSAASKIEALRRAEVSIANTPEDIPKLVKSLL